MPTFTTTRAELYRLLFFHAGAKHKTATHLRGAQDWRNLISPWHAALSPPQRAALAHVTACTQLLLFSLFLFSRLSFLPRLRPFPLLPPYFLPRALAFLAVCSCLPQGGRARSSELGYCLPFLSMRLPLYCAPTGIRWQHSKSAPAFSALPTCWRTDCAGRYIRGFIAGLKKAATSVGGFCGAALNAVHTTLAACAGWWGGTGSLTPLPHLHAPARQHRYRWLDNPEEHA